MKAYRSLLSVAIALMLIISTVTVGFSLFPQNAVGESNQTPGDGKDKDATLSALSLSVANGTQGVVIAPAQFNPNTTHYSAEVEGDVTKISIHATASNPSASVTGTGTYDFPGEGERRTYSVVVTAADGVTTMTYTIIVTGRVRTGLGLKSLKATGAKVKKVSATEYEATVNGSVTSTEIMAVPEDSSSVVSGDIGEKKLKYGVNVFKITVKNAANQTKTYVLSITRLRNEDRLKSLKAKSVTLKPAFDPDRLTYKATVSYSVKKTKISAKAVDPKAQVDGDLGEQSLETGLNTFTVTVEAQDGTIKTYTLEITRKKKSSASATKTPAPTAKPEETKEPEETEEPEETVEPVPTEEPVETGTEGDETEIIREELEDVESALGTFVLLTPLTEGMDRVALLVVPNAKVRLFIDGVSMDAEADEYGYLLFTVDPLKADATIDIRIEDEDGKVTGWSGAVDGQEESPSTLVHAYPASGLRATFDRDEFCYAMPLIKLTEDDFDTDGQLTMPLLVGGVYNIGTVTIKRDIGGAIETSYTLSEAFAGSEVISEELRIFVERPSDAMLLLDWSEPLNEPIEVSWKRPVWMTLSIWLKIDVGALPGLSVERWEWDYKTLQMDVHGR